MDDRELVRGMLAGDESTFTAFFNDYFPRIYRFALPRLSGDAEATRDVVQATLVKAIRNLSQFRGDAALFTWVCQICRHQVVDYVRTHRRRHQQVISIDDSPEVRAALESLEAPASDEPLQHYGQEETRRLIRNVLDRLPANYGDVLEWKYIEGRSVEEIGNLLGIGTTAAQSMLARARVSFREALETVFGATTSDVLAGLRSAI